MTDGPGEAPRHHVIPSAARQNRRDASPIARHTRSAVRNEDVDDKAQLLTHVPHAVSQIQKSDDGTADAFIRALSSKNFTQAINLISADNYADLSGDFIDWANGPVTVRGPSCLRKAVEAISRRAVREPHFIRTAVRVLQDMINRIRSDTLDNIALFIFSHSLKPLALTMIENIVMSTLLVILTQDKDLLEYSAISDVGDMSCSSLSDEEFAKRYRNADVFIAQLLQNNMAPKDRVCQLLAPNVSSAAAVYSRLLVLGPSLDHPEKCSHLDSVLLAHENAQAARFSPRSSRDDCLEKIKKLRARGWDKKPHSTPTK